MTTPFSPFSVVDSARKLALAEHASHRHGKYPYSYHLVAVAGIVSCFTSDPDVIAAAWLHDIVEDCEDITLDVVEQMTNYRVRTMVDYLTDPPEMPRFMAKQYSLPRIQRDRDACLIKMADRYHNQASTILDQSKKYAQMYLDESAEFLRAMNTGALQYHVLIGMIESQLPHLRHILHEKG